MWNIPAGRIVSMFIVVMLDITPAHSWLYFPEVIWDFLAILRAVSLHRKQKRIWPSSLTGGSQTSPGHLKIQAWCVWFWVWHGNSTLVWIIIKSRVGGALTRCLHEGGVSRGEYVIVIWYMLFSHHENSFLLFTFFSLSPPPQINIFLSHANSYATVVGCCLRSVWMLFLWIFVRFSREKLLQLKVYYMLDSGPLNVLHVLKYVSPISKSYFAVRSSVSCIT